MTMPPPVKKKVYNKTKMGFFGQLGQGANAHIKFIQTAITYDELDAITLIQDIPGSEKWDVRDLFQRDVDTERVEKDILPYLKDTTKVKYFNPLTLVVVPLDESQMKIEKEIFHATPYTETDEGHEYTVYEREGFYRIRVHKESPAFSSIAWNDSKVKIVAIDGQHRLSALIRWKNEPTDDISLLKNWTIPVVIIGLFKADQNKSASSVLEIIRRTFVYINSKAEEVSPARKILLNDESVNAVCTQELIQLAHANDVKKLSQRNRNMVPLIFYDWRGQTKDGKRITAPASIKNIIEIHSWFESYILGQDGSTEQETALGLEDMIPPLKSFGEDLTLDTEDQHRIREQFRKTVLPGLSYLLENFSPYKKYIAECRTLEEKARQEHDTSKHAFMKLRFGSSRAPEHIKDDVDEKLRELIRKLSNIKRRTFKELLGFEIGMRGIIFAFGKGKSYYDQFLGKTNSWLDYAEWFTSKSNSVYNDGWFESYDELDEKVRDFMTHLAYDSAGTIINYKIEDVPKAFGALLIILIFSKDQSKIGKERLENIWDDYSDSIENQYKRGFRKLHRSVLKESFRGTPKEFNQHVSEKAKQSASERIYKLQEYIGIY